MRVVSIEQLLKEHPGISEPPKISGDRALELVRDFMLSRPTDDYSPEELAFREELVKWVVNLPEGSSVDIKE